MVVVGTSAQWSKDTHQQSIAEKWGDDWFDNIPSSMRPAESVKDLSKRMLSEVAITCANITDQQQAVIGWRSAIERRLDPANRPPRTRILKTRKLIPEDVKFFNGTLSTTASGIREDVLELMPVVTTTPQQQPSPTARTKDSSRKRKRVESSDPTTVLSESEPSGKLNDQSISLQHRDGKTRVKKVRGHRIIEPVTLLEESPGADLSQLLDDIPFSSFDNADGALIDAPSKTPTCDGPEFARMFAKFAEIHAYFEKHGTSSTQLVRNCCDSCRDYALRALACLKADLVPSVAGLEQVKKHTFGGGKTAASEESDGPLERPTPHLQKSNRLLRVIQDSSDEENEEIAV